MPATKQERDIRKALKDMAAYAGRITSSTAKMFLASGKEMLSINMPTLTGSLETNRELVENAIRVLRNPADAVNRSVEKATQTETFGALQKFAKNALDDLKTGNLYDPNRDRTEIGAQMEDMLNSFGGFDMTGFDENGDWTEPEGLSPDLEGEVTIADIQDQNASRRTSATIEAIGASTEAITSTVNANGQANIRTSLKQHSQVMQTLTNSLSVQTAQLQALDSSARAAMDLARESHNQILGQMHTMTSLLEEIRDNTKPKAPDREVYKETNSPFGANGELDIKAYIKNVIRNIDEEFGISSTVGTATLGMSPKELLEKVGDNPWQLITDLVLGAVVPNRLKEQMQRTDTNLKNFFPALFDKLAARRNRQNKYGESSFVDVIASLFGVKQRSRTSIDTAIRNVNEQATFTRRTATAIETVIPSLLSQINSSISGQPYMVYNYQTGKFERARDVIYNTNRRAQDLVGNMGSARKAFDMADRYRFRSDKEREDFQNYMYQFFQERANDENDRFINPFEDKRSFMKKMPDSANQEYYYNLLMGIFKNMERRDLQQMSSDIFESRRMRDRQNTELNNELRDNGLIAAFNGLAMDDTTQYRLRGAARKTYMPLTGGGIDAIVDKRKKEMIRQGGVQASNVLLNEILGTLKKGIITYSYNAGTLASDEGGDELLKAVLRERTNQRDLETAILNNVNAYKNRTDEQYRRQMSEAAANMQKEGLTTRDYVTDTLSEESIVGMMRDSLKVLPSAKDTDNPALKFAKQYSEKLSGSASKVLDKTGVMSIFDKVRKMTESPFSFMEQALQTMDAFMFKMLYGEDAAVQLENGGEPSLMNSVIQAVKVQFQGAKEWFKTNIGDPIRNTLFDKDKGLFPRLGRSLKENFIDPLTQPLKDRAKKAVTSAKEKLIGRKNEETGLYEGGKFSNAANQVTGGKNGAGGALENTVVNALNKLLYGDNVVTKGKRVIDIGDERYDEEKHEFVKGTRKIEYSGVVGTLRKGFDSFNRFLFGDKFESDPDAKAENQKSRERFNDMKKELGKAAPSMAKGAGLGLLASFFLPGGPLLGALAGSFGGLIKGSDKFSKFLLGDFAEEEEVMTDVNGKPIPVDPKDPSKGFMKKKVNRRQGGIISKKTADGLQRFVPGVTKGALIGAVAGGLGLLPFGMGSAAGTVIGAIGGMTGASEQMKKLIFGDGVDEKSGLISKEFREKVKKQVKNAAGPALGGAALGAAAWGAVSSLGIIPGLSLIPGGPIFTMLGGITGAVNADSIKKFFFGEDAEVTEEVEGEDGKKTTVTRKTKKGGIFNKAYETVENHFLKPMGERISKVGESISNWFQDSVVKPFSNALKPMKEEMHKALGNIKNSLKNVGQSILDGIGSAIGVSFNGEDGKGGLSAFVRDKLIKPLDKITSTIFSSIGKAIGKLVSAPFRALEFIFSPETRKERVDKEKSEKQKAKEKKREEHRQKRQEKIQKKRQKRADKQKERLRAVARRFGLDYDMIIADIAPDTTTPEGAAEAAEANPIADAMEAMGYGADGSGGVSYDLGSGSSGYTNPEYYGIDSDSMDETTTMGGNVGTGDSKAVRDYKNKKSKERQKNVIEKERLEAAAQKSIERNKRKQIRDEMVRQKREQREQEQAAKEQSKNAVDKTQKRTGKKTNNEYLEKINNRLKDIYDEIKGQVNGVGWNTAYIKTLLEKQFGQSLSDDELPPEMEGSRKSISKKRGLFGRLKDKATGIFGNAKDRVTGFIGNLKDSALGPILDVINFFGDAKDAVTGGIGRLWGGVKKVGGGIAKGAKAIGRGVSFVGSILGAAVKDMVDIIGAIGPGIARSIGNMASFVTGALKDVGLAITGTIAGFIQTAAEIAPDIASLVWGGIKKGAGAIGKFGKFIGKGIVGGIGKVAGGIRHGVSWMFGKIFGRGKDDEDDEAADGKGGRKGKRGKGSRLKLNGGFLDEIKESVHIKIGPKAHAVNFPYVSVMRGKAITKKNNIAIPVYIVGADDAAKLHVIPIKSGGNEPANIPEGNAPTPPKVIGTGTDEFAINPVEKSTSKGQPVHGDATGDQLRAKQAQERSQKKEKITLKNLLKRTFKRTYAKINKASETASPENMGEVYDRAIQNANSEEEIEAVKTVAQLNQGTQVAAAASDGTGEEQKKGGFLSSLLNMFGGGKALLALLGKALPFIASFGALTFGLTQEGEGHVAVRGAEGLVQETLRSTGLNKWSPKQIAEMATDPSAAAKYQKEAAEKAAKAGSKGSRKAWTRAGKAGGVINSIGDFFTWIKNPADAQAAIDLGKEAGGLKGLGMRLKGTAAKGIGNVTRAATELGDKVVNSKTVQNAISAGGNALSQLKSKASGVIGAALDKLMSNKVVKTLAGKLATKFSAVKSKVTKILTGTFFEKAAKMVGKESLEATARSVLGLSTAGIATAIFAVVDFVTGFNSASQIFNVHTSQVTLGMKLTAAFYRAISGAISIIPYLGTILSIVFSFAEDALVQAIYGIFADDAAEEELKRNQEQVAANAEAAGMTVDEYTKKFNADGTPRKGLFASIGSAISNVAGGIWNGVKSIGSGIWNGIKGIGTGIGNFFANIFGLNKDEESGSGIGFYGAGPGSVTPISQRSSKYNKYDNSMALAGCGPAAFSMVGSAYGKKLDPRAMSNAAYGMGMRASDGGTNPAFFSKAANVFGAGFGMQEGPVSGNMIGRNVSKGQPVVVMGKGGPYGSHMHYLVADGTNGRGGVNYVDPMTGSRKTTKMSSLTKNTRNAIYSYGTGRWGTGSIDMQDERNAVASGQDITGTTNADGSRSYNASEVQQMLVDKMTWLHNNPIPYSLEGPQNPDKGSASCASTVGWAYNKVLGLTGMSASSATQSQDDRFTDIIRLGQPGAQPGKTFDLSLLQPGDIVYMYNKFNSGGGSNHTEMYVGNGQDLSHGGPDKGPQYRTLDATRQKKVFAVRRYKPFTDKNTKIEIDPNAMNNTSSSSSGDDSSGVGIINSVSDLAKAGGAFAASAGMQALSTILGGMNSIGTALSGAYSALTGVLFGDSGDESNSGSTEDSSTTSATNVSKTSKNVPSASGLDGSTKDIWKYLVGDVGMTPTAAAGMMGCWNSESSNNPKRVEADWIDGFPGYDAIGNDTEARNKWTTDVIFKKTKGIDKSGYIAADGNYYPGLGIAQWTGSRGKSLLDYAKSKNLKWYTFDAQFPFAVSEMQSRGLIDKMNAATTVNDATKQFLEGYEMYSGWTDKPKGKEQLAERSAAATAIYNQYKDLDVTEGKNAKKTNASLSADETTGAGPGFGTGLWDTSNLRNMFGNKSKKLMHQPSYGTGSNRDANLSALNDRIRKYNNLLANTQQDASNNEVTKVVSKLSDAMTGNSVSSDETKAILSAIAASITTMVQLLTDIKSNTTPVETGPTDGQDDSKSKYSSLPTAEGHGTMPRNYNERSYKTGAAIINQLTSK